MAFVKISLLLVGVASADIFQSQMPTAHVADLRRAHLPKPPAGSPVLGQTSEHALAGMVKALRSSGVQTRPCHQWNLQDLNTVAVQLLEKFEPSFDILYKNRNDRRTLHFDPKSNHKEVLWEAEKSLEVHSTGFNLTRDGKCAELSMWWVHHLPYQARATLSKSKDFSLPEPPAKLEDPKVAKTHGAKEYVYQITCAACHVNIGPQGVIPAPTPTPPSGPKWDICDKDPKHPGLVWYEGEKAPVGTRKKRADWDYSPPPIMCEAIGGKIWGDGKGEIIFPECEPVMNASDIPKDNLTSPVWPLGFTVKEYAIGINQCDKVDDPFGCKFPGSKPCAPHKFLNETYYAEYYDGSATGPRVTVHRNDGNIIQPKNGNMYVQTMPNHPRFDFCICVGTAQDGAAPPAPVLGALRHDFAKDAILIGREKIKLEYLDRYAVCDHWMKGPHNFWVEVSTNLMVRGWQAYNGLQIWYDWNATMPEEAVFAVPEGCYKGLLHHNVSCRSGPPSPPPTPGKMLALVSGFVDGVLSKDMDLSNCIKEGTEEPRHFTAAMNAWKEKHFVEALTDLVEGIKELPSVLHDCSDSLADVRKVLNAVKHLTKYQITHNWIAHEMELHEVLSSALQNYRHGDFKEAGRQIGSVIHVILENDDLFV